MADSEGLYTPHSEVTYPSDKLKLSELKVLTVDPEEPERRNEEIKKRFVEFFRRVSYLARSGSRLRARELECKNSPH